MCRLFAYISVKPILLDDVLRRPVNAISKQILAEWQGESFINADGFGITWHTDERSSFNPLIELEAMGKEVPERSFADTLDDIIKIYDGPLISYVRGPHPAMYKTTIAKPLNDPSFLSLCANISSKCIFAHLRAADDPPVATTNNHPFVFGRHCFMHNGIIENFGKIRKEVLDNVSPGFTAMIEGGTDTEHLAALYMTYLCEPKDFRGADNHYPTSSMWMALKAAIDKVEGIQRSRGMNPDNYFNICTTGGENLLGLCYRTTVSVETPVELWLSVNAADILNRKSYGHSNGTIFKDKRSATEINEAARKLRQTAKSAIRRGPDNKVKDIEPELQRLLDEEEADSLYNHGQHVIISSEPTSIQPGWFKLDNRDVILVSTMTMTKDDGTTVQTIKMDPETF